MITKVMGFVVRTIDYKDSSLLVYLLTHEYGLIGLIAKGAKQMKSKLRSGTSKFTYGYFYIYYKEDIIQLIGLENTGDCSGLINETNEKSYKIALIHQPDYFKEISQYSIQLQLSGHTLGGYYKIPFIGGIETKDKGKNYVNGKHTKNKTTLLISNGFNKESSENHRFLTRDEVNIITLKR